MQMCPMTKTRADVEEDLMKGTFVEERAERNKMSKWLNTEGNRQHSGERRT